MRVGSANVANFATKLLIMATSLQRSRNEWTLNEALPYRCTSTNPEYLMIGWVDSEITGWAFGPLERKRKKKQKHNIVRSAVRPSGLIWLVVHWWTHGLSTCNRSVSATARYCASCDTLFKHAITSYIHISSSSSTDHQWMTSQTSSPPCYCSTCVAVALFTRRYCCVAPDR